MALTPDERFKKRFDESFRTLIVVVSFLTFTYNLVITIQRFRIVILGVLLSFLILAVMIWAFQHVIEGPREYQWKLFAYYLLWFDLFATVSILVAYFGDLTSIGWVHMATATLLTLAVIIPTGNLFRKRGVISKKFLYFYIIVAFIISIVILGLLV